MFPNIRRTRFSDLSTGIRECSPSVQKHLDCSMSEVPSVLRLALLRVGAGGLLSWNDLDLRLVRADWEILVVRKR
jgi:hypothetical protein